MTATAIPMSAAEQTAHGKADHQAFYPDPEWHGHLRAAGVTEWHRHTHAPPPPANAAPESPQAYNRGYQDRHQAGTQHAIATIRSVTNHYTPPEITDCLRQLEAQMKALPGHDNR